MANDPDLTNCFYSTPSHAFALGGRRLLGLAARLLLRWWGVDRPDRNRKRRVLETVVHPLGVLCVSDEPSGIATAHGRLGDVNHVLQRACCQIQRSKCRRD